MAMYSMKIINFAPAINRRKGEKPHSLQRKLYGKDNRTIQAYNSKGMETTTYDTCEMVPIR